MDEPLTDLLDRPFTLIVSSILFVAVASLTIRAQYDAEWLYPYLGTAGGLLFGIAGAGAMLLHAHEGHGSRWLYLGLFAGSLTMVVVVHALGIPSSVPAPAEPNQLDLNRSLPSLLALRNFLNAFAG